MGELYHKFIKSSFNFDYHNQVDKNQIDCTITISDSHGNIIEEFKASFTISFQKVYNRYELKMTNKVPPELENDLRGAFTRTYGKEPNKDGLKAELNMSATAAYQTELEKKEALNRSSNITHDYKSFF
jgi:hypothetical protein